MSLHVKIDGGVDFQPILIDIVFLAVGLSIFLLFEEFLEPGWPVLP